MPDNPNDPNKEEGFVSRWSRRKQQVAAEASSEQVMAKTISKEAATESLKNSSDVKVIQEELIDPEVIKAQRLEALNKLTDEDMPDIETLDENSDFSGFMSTSVSEGLRNMALKKLFMGKSYNIRDGLDEYDGDYTKFEKMPKSMVTSDMKHMVGVEAKKKLEKEQEELREKMIASGELDDDYDGIEEFDELDEDNADLAEIEEAYVDEHINVEGFDTSTSNAAEVNEAEEETAKDNSLHKNDNEEVA